jgi:hypothetical protein
MLVRRPKLLIWESDRSGSCTGKQRQKDKLRPAHLTDVKLVAAFRYGASIRAPSTPKALLSNLFAWCGVIWKAFSPVAHSDGAPDCLQHRAARLESGQNVLQPRVVAPLADQICTCQAAMGRTRTHQNYGQGEAGFKCCAAHSISTR